MKICKLNVFGRKNSLKSLKITNFSNQPKM